MDSITEHLPATNKYSQNQCNTRHIQMAIWWLWWGIKLINNEVLQVDIFLQIIGYHKNRIKKSGNILKLNFIPNVLNILH